MGGRDPCCSREGLENEFKRGERGDPRCSPKGLESRRGV